MNVEQNLPNKIMSVINLARHWQSSMPKKPGRRDENGEQRQWEGLLVLLEDFKVFARDYATLLRRAPLPNQRFIVNDGVQRLLKNFDVLSRASEQRRGSVTRDSLAFYLAQAEDKLSSYCSRWQPGVSDSYLTLKTPVVYFEKAFHISRSLYAPEIPLVSIPLTEYNDPDRWLALAHEMGHHIFWNSLKNLEDVEKLHLDMYTALAEPWQQAEGDILQPWGLWLEEMFADICGVLFAGPSYVVSSQNLAAEWIRDVEDFAENDNEHPSLYLRPWIAYEVLYRVMESSDHARALLNRISERWSTFCGDAPTLKCNCGARGEVSLENLRQEAGKVVDILLNKPIWPNNQRLRDLIQYENQELDLETLEALPPLSQELPRKVAPQAEDIPQSIAAVWNFIQKKLVNDQNKPSQEKEDPKTLWNALVSLSLEDEHGHWPLRAGHAPQVHWWAPWAGLHTHDPATGRVKLW